MYQIQSVSVFLDIAKFADFAPPIRDQPRKSPS